MIDAKILQAHFDTAFDAPDGIKKLRELILTLAMQGKLVPQDPKDEPASELLKKIEAEKKRLVKEGKIKASRGEAEKAEVKGPYELPKGWVWTRLGSLCSKITDGEHQTPPRLNNGCLLLSAKNVRDGFIDFDNCDNISYEDYDKARSRCKPEKGDLLIVSVGGTIGRTSLVGDKTDFALVRSVAIIKPLLMNSYFLRILFTSPLVQESIHSNKRGGAQPCLYLSEIEKFPIPLPPLAEQKRIVAKIDQLIARCDELEKMREERHAKRLAAHAAAIKDLLAPSGNFGFISTYFSEFYSVRENVAELRKAILQLAVMGKLVLQDPKDQPASELLKDIQREKARLVKEGKIKASRGDVEKAEVVGPYELPKGWVWTRLGDITDIIAGASFNSNDFNNSSGARCIKITNAGVGEFIETEDYLPATFVKDYPNFLIHEGDMILALTRPYIKDGLKISICPKSYDNSLLNQRVASIRSFSNLLHPSYSFTYFKSTYVLNLYKSKYDDKSQQPNMKIGDVTELVFPLPPLAEQKRIVAKIDQLMALCDSLAQQITISSAKQDQLLSALVAGV